MFFFKKLFGPKILSKEVFDSFFSNSDYKFLIIKLFLRALILIFFLILIIRPQWDFISSSKENISYNLVFAIDNSLSSLAMDWMDKNRLDRSKDFISESVKELGFWNYSLVEFSWESFISIPFTTDINSFNSILSLIDINDSLSWTSFGSSLKNIVSVFSYKNLDKKIVILLTDWENQEWFDGFEYLRDNWVTIVSIWVWSIDWSKIPLYIENWYIVYKTYQGENVVTKLNESFLKEVSEKTWWKYFGEDDFDSFISYIKSEAPKTVSLDWDVERREYFQIIAFFIFLILIFEIFFQKKYLKFLPFFAFILTLSSCSNPNWNKWIEDYHSWNFSSSSEIFQNFAENWDNDYAFFNFWSSLYKQWDFKKAYDNFQKIKEKDLINSWNLDYQLWNTSYKIWDNENDLQKKVDFWKESISYYELWLQKNPNDKDMRENLDFVKKKLEDLQKQMEEKWEKKEEDWEWNEDEKWWWMWDINLEKKELDWLKEELQELKAQESWLKWNFDRFWKWEFKLEWEPSTLNMKSLKDILNWTVDSGHEDFQTGDKDW